jgi:voltage-gated potassium channel
MFIFVLTVLSLLIMVALVVPRVSAPTKQLLNIYDNIICAVFLGDFAMRLPRAPRKRDYLIGERGWLDLLGSIPSFQVLGKGKHASLFRLARLSRLARINRLIRGQSKRELVDDVLEHRGQYAIVITLLAAAMVLVLASVFALQFETQDPNANIRTGSEALWWSWVTHHDGGLRRLLPRDRGRSGRGLRGDAHRHRHHRRAREHLREPARAAGSSSGRRRAG